MGKMILFVVIGLSLLYTVLNYSAKNSNMRMIDNSAVSYKHVQAKAISESGIELAAMKLSQDTNWTAGVSNLAMNGGYLKVKVASYPAKGNRIITSIGTFKDAAGNVIAKDSSVVTLLTKLPPVDDTPGFMKNALTSESSIAISGSSTIQDDGNTMWNANIHANGNYSMEGSATVEGFVTHNGTATSQPASALNNHIIPNQNPNHLATHSQVPKLTIPPFNADDYKSKAAVITNGSLTKSGNTILGTKSNPMIWYVSGDLTLSGTVTGYGIFIVEGNINLSGSVTINAVDPNGNSLALYSHGDVNVGGGSSVNAQLYSDKNINFNGSADLHGLATARGSFYFGGSVNVYYRPSVGELTAPVWNVSGASNRKRAIVQAGTYYD